MPISLSVVTDAGRAVGTFRCRQPTAREALAVLTSEGTSPEEALGALRPILAAWWPLSMASVLLSRRCSPSVALSTARWLVASGVPEDARGAEDRAASETAPDWDILAVEVRSAIGLSLDEPWPDWVRAALWLDRVRARAALSNLSWYIAAKSTDRSAYDELLRRAGYPEVHAPVQTAEEGLANMQALRRQWAVGVA